MSGSTFLAGGCFSLYSRLDMVDVLLALWVGGCS